MTSCIGWLLDVSIDNDHAILAIRAEEEKILKLKLVLIYCEQKIGIYPIYNFV